MYVSSVTVDGGRSVCCRSGAQIGVGEEHERSGAREQAVVEISPNVSMDKWKMFERAMFLVMVCVAISCLCYHVLNLDQTREGECAILGTC
jgi:hypothetical protein